MPPLTCHAARKAVDLAITTAETRFGNRPICVAVCDDSGNLLAFARMDCAPLRSVRIAQHKASTSVLMGSTTAEFGLRLRNEGLIAADFCHEGLTPIAGGRPIWSEGTIVGGIGVSGLKPEEDDALAAECDDASRLV